MIDPQTSFNLFMFFFLGMFVLIIFTLIIRMVAWSYGLSFGKAFLLLAAVWFVMFLWISSFS